MLKMAVVLNMFVENTFFFLRIDWIVSSKEQCFGEMENFNNDVKVFTVTWLNFNASYQLLMQTLVNSSVGLNLH